MRTFYVLHEKYTKHIDRLATKELKEVISTSSTQDHEKALETLNKDYPRSCVVNFSGPPRDHLNKIIRAIQNSPSPYYPQGHWDAAVLPSMLFSGSLLSSMNLEALGDSKKEFRIHYVNDEGKSCGLCIHYYTAANDKPPCWVISQISNLEEDVSDQDHLFILSEELNPGWAPPIPTPSFVFTTLSVLAIGLAGVALVAGLTAVLPFSLPIIAAVLIAASLLLFGITGIFSAVRNNSRAESQISDANNNAFIQPITATDSEVVRCSPQKLFEKLKPHLKSKELEALIQPIFTNNAPEQEIQKLKEILGVGDNSMQNYSSHKTKVPASGPHCSGVFFNSSHRSEEPVVTDTLQIGSVPK